MIKKYAQANPGELSKKVNEVANQFNRNLNKNNTRQNQNKFIKNIFEFYSSDIFFGIIYKLFKK